MTPPGRIWNLLESKQNTILELFQKCKMQNKNPHLFFWHCCPFKDLAADSPQYDTPTGEISKIQ